MDQETGCPDQVHITGLKFNTVVGLDCWHRPGKSQPVELSVDLTPASANGLEQAAQEDSVAYTIDYGKLYKQLLPLFDQKYDTIHQLYQAIRTSLPPARAWTIRVTLPKGILAASKGLQITWDNYAQDGNTDVMQILEIPDIDCRCIIGVNPHERLEKQRLQISITVTGMENRLSPSILAGVSIDPSPTLIYQDMVQSVVERVESSSYETIEALATAICQIVTMQCGFDNARVKIEKPGGIAGSGSSGVTIARVRSFFENKDFWKIKRP